QGSADPGTSGPMGPLGPHFRPRVHRVIQLFMNGGASQIDTFDHKPELDRKHGEKFDPGDGSRVEAATSEPGRIMKSPFAFQRHGQSGRWVSSVFPHLARKVDDLAFLMSIESRTNVHGPASFLMNTGSLLPGFPSLGAWVSYALGNETGNLPTFVVLPDARGLPYNQRGNFSAGFLPATHAATIIDAGAAEPIPYLHPPASAGGFAEPAVSDAGKGLDLLRRMNRRHEQASPGDSRLEARIRSYELAARMQLAAPETFDLGAESEATRRLYGLDDKVTEDFGRRCLLARRLVERGVRFVQVWSGAGGPSNNWDNHTDIITELPKIATSTDKPIAGLLEDLRARGLLEDTLVVWSTEFGRMPFTQGATGRDHNGGTSIGWMAGAGVRPGVACGESDPWGWKALEKITTYDVHATLLHLLGLDHERLTVRNNGADRRLTDVHGHVIQGLLA
ncbi:MAG: DUF1501 domain-containing protein, partial [Limisphaerales bacterium]